MYRILKVLNNNVALIKHANGQQSVVMGLGLTVGKKKGDIIRSEAIEKFFIMRNEESKQNFMDLVKDLPMDFVTVCYEMINEITEKYQFPVQEYIYTTLTYHIYYAYKSIQKGEYRSGKMPDIESDFPEEFEMARDGVKIIEKKLNIELPDEEVERVAFHFINAKGTELPHTNHQISRSKHIIEEIREVLTQYHIERNPNNSDFYDRFMIHLNYIIDRKEPPVVTNDEAMKNMAESLKVSYKNSFEISEKIFDILQDFLTETLSETEKVYLTLHIQRLQ